MTTILTLSYIYYAIVALLFTIGVIAEVYARVTKDPRVGPIKELLVTIPIAICLCVAWPALIYIWVRLFVSIRRFNRQRREALNHRRMHRDKVRAMTAILCSTSFDEFNAIYREYTPGGFYQRPSWWDETSNAALRIAIRNYPKSDQENYILHECMGGRFA